MLDFIYLKHGQGVAFVDAHVESFNFDPSKGGLFCKYSGIFGEDLPIETVMEVGLCEQKRLDGAIIVRDVAYEKREKSVQISVILRLNEGENVRFLAQENGGDNPLVGNILRGITSTNGYQIALVDDEILTDSMYFDASWAKEKRDASVAYQDGILSITGQNFLGVVKEIVVFFDQKAVLKTAISAENMVKVSSVLATKKGVVTLKESHILDVFDVSVDSVFAVSWSACPCVDGLSFLGESGFKIGKNAVVKGGKNGKNLVIDGEGIGVFNGTNFEQWHCGFDGKIVSNGAKILFDECVSIDAQNGLVTLPQIRSGVKNEAVFAGGVYLILCYFDGQKVCYEGEIGGQTVQNEGEIGGQTVQNGKILTINRVNSADFSVTTSVVELDSLVESSEVYLLDMLGTYIGVASREFCEVYTAIGTETSLKNWLNSIKNNFDSDHEIGFESGRLTLYKRAENTTKYVEFLSNIFSIFNGKLFGEFVLVSSQNNSKIFHFDRLQIPLATISGQVDALTFDGKRLLAFDSTGRILIFSVDSKQTRLFSPSIVAGSRVDYSVRFVNPPIGASALTVKLNVEH